MHCQGGWENSDLSWRWTRQRHCHSVDLQNKTAKTARPKHSASSASLSALVRPEAASTEHASGRTKKLKAKRQAAKTGSKSVGSRNIQDAKQEAARACKLL